MAADNKGTIQLRDQRREMLSKLNHIASMLRFLEIYQGKKQKSYVIQLPTKNMLTTSNNIRFAEKHEKNFGIKEI